MAMDEASLDRFHRAQDQPHAGYADALREMQAGAKRSHWIWYILPQLSGLGMSDMARRYGLRGASEAEAYLRDPVLRGRLLAVAAAVATHVVPPASTPLSHLMGSEVDARKLVSSLTLFEHVARRLAEDHGGHDFDALADVATRVLDALAGQGYDRCAFTRTQLSRT
jgi:uncharacterized protein (DUF1810 family)